MILPRAADEADSSARSPVASSTLGCSRAHLGTLRNWLLKRVEKGCHGLDWYVEEFPRRAIFSGVDVVALRPWVSVARALAMLQVVISAPASHYVYPRLSCKSILPQLATAHTEDTAPFSHPRWTFNGLQIIAPPIA